MANGKESHNFSANRTSLAFASPREFSGHIMTDTVLKENIEMNKTKILRCVWCKERIRLESTNKKEVNMIIKFYTKCNSFKEVKLNNLLEVKVWEILHQGDDI